MPGRGAVGGAIRQRGRKPTQIIYTQRSPWVVDYAPEHCSLNRVYGTAPDVLNLQITSYGSYSELRFLMFGNQIPRQWEVGGQLTYWYAAQPDERRTATALYGPVGNTPGVSFWAPFRPKAPPPPSHISTEQSLAYASKVYPLDSDFERRATDLTIAPAPGKQINLHLGSMAEPLAALRRCVDDLNTGSASILCRNAL